MRLIPNLTASDLRNQRPTNAEARGNFLARPVCRPDGIGALSARWRAHPVRLTTAAAFRHGVLTVLFATREAFRLQSGRVRVPLGNGAVPDGIVPVFQRRSPTQIDGGVVRFASIVMRHLMGRGRLIPVEGSANELVDKARLIPAAHKQVHARVSCGAANRLRKHLQSAPALVGDSPPHTSQRRDFIVRRGFDYLPSFHGLVVSAIASNCKAHGGKP